MKFSIILGGLVALTSAVAVPDTEAPEVITSLDQFQVFQAKFDDEVHVENIDGEYLVLHGSSSTSVGTLAGDALAYAERLAARKVDAAPVSKKRRADLELFERQGCRHIPCNYRSECHSSCFMCFENACY